MYKGKQLEFLKKSFYLEEGETPEDRVRSIVGVVRRYESQYSDGLADRIYNLIKNKILILSTPQFANLGREEKGNTTALPCSCNIVSVENSIEGIGYAYGETAVLSKLGAGVGLHMEEVLSEGEEISKGFKANSRLDWGEDLVGVAQKVSQGKVRRGYATPFFDIEAPELPRLLERVSKNNPNKEDCFVDNTIGVYVSDEFLEKVYTGDRECAKKYFEVLNVRRGGGNLYIVFTGNMVKNISPVYEVLGHKPTLTNICTEAVTPSYDDKTFSCILSSLNLNKWDYINGNPQVIQDAYMFLDICVSEYIRLTEGVKFLEKARRSAIEKRDIGLGALGFHDYIQSKGYAFGDLDSRRVNRHIFSTIRKYVDKTNEYLANKLGACPMAREAGLNMRNVSQMMIAPNKSTAFIAGQEITNLSGLSAGINPLMSNYFTQNLKAVTEVYKNKRLENLLNSIGKNTEEVWDSILENLGSVQHLDFLSEKDKQVFRTFSEISPKDIIDLASDRQQYLDMAQSLNLINRPNYTIQDVYNIHKYAHEKGIKTLYYFYAQAHANLEKEGESWDDCISCAD